MSLQTKNRYTNWNWNLATRQQTRWSMGFLKLGSIIISNVYKKQKWPKEEGALPSLQTKIARYCNKEDVDAYSSFEHNIFNTQLGSRVFTIIGIYNPPQGTEPQFSNSNSIDQVKDLLTGELPKHPDLIIMGDINIHINNSED